MPRETYPQPEHGWTCFHCGETFTDRHLARDHFGHYPSAYPACQLAPEHVRRELRLFRCQEGALAPIKDRLGNMVEGFPYESMERHAAKELYDIAIKLFDIAYSAANDA